MMLRDETLVRKNRRRLIIYFVIQSIYVLIGCVDWEQVIYHYTDFFHEMGMPVQWSAGSSTVQNLPSLPLSWHVKIDPAYASGLLFMFVILLVLIVAQHITSVKAQYQYWNWFLFIFVALLITCVLPFAGIYLFDGIFSKPLALYRDADYVSSGGFLDWHCTRTHCAFNCGPISASICIFLLGNFFTFVLSAILYSIEVIKRRKIKTR